MPKLAVVGQPISHSLSPLMQNAALEETGLAAQGWTYEAIELSPEQLAPEIRRLAADPEWAGVNVTIPHKSAALALATGASPAAREIGAANTLTFTAAATDAGGGDPAPAIEADNTDAPALIDALGDPPAGERALVLGAGGSARAMVWALREAGAEVTIWNRTHERGAALAAEMGVEALPEGERPDPARFRLLVNTTAVGLGVDASSRHEGAELKALGIEADQLSERHVVVDLVYGPAETELIRAAKDRGAMAIDGLEILVRQGARSFRIWTGFDAPLATMTQAVRTPE